MQTLHAVREARATKVNEARSLLASSPTLTPDAQIKFDSLKAEIVALEASEARAQFMEEAERRSLGVAVDKGRSDMEVKTTLLEAIRCQVEGRSAQGAVGEYSREVERRTGVKGIYVPMSAFETRAQTTTTAAGIVPEDFRADLFVGPLKNSLVMRSLGARVLTGLKGDVVVPKHKTSMSAGWISEGESLSESGMTFETMGLTPKTVGGLTELSLRLVQQSSPQIEQLVRDDLSAVLAEAFDTAMLNGDGVKEPLGLLNSVGVQTASLGTLDWPAVLAMLEALALKNVNPSAWLTSPQVATKLRSILKSASAGAGYLMEGGQVAGLPVAVTNQVPIKTLKGQIVLGDFSELFVATWDSIQILVNPYDSAAYARGGVKVRALMTADSAVRRAEAFVVASDVTL